MVGSAGYCGVLECNGKTMFSTCRTMRLTDETCESRTNATQSRTTSPSQGIGQRSCGQGKDAFLHVSFLGWGRVNFEECYSKEKLWQGPKETALIVL